MLRQAGSFSKITSIASGQRVLRCGWLVGTGMYMPGGSSGSCARSASSLLFCSGMLCDMLGTILLVYLSAFVMCSTWQCMAVTEWLSRGREGDHVGLLRQRIVRRKIPKAIQAELLMVL